MRQFGDSVVVFSGESSPALKRDIEYSYNPKFADKGLGFAILIDSAIIVFAELINNQ